MSEKRTENHPEISVIVPVYKVEKYLNECIDSILAQTFTDFELILVDDGSPDNCPALCDAAAAKDSRIRVIHQQNKGLSGARNAGIEIARGNWLSFIDSDDSIDKTCLEKMHRAAVQSGAEVASCNILYLEADGSRSSYQDTPLRNEVISREEAIHRIRLTPLVQAATRLHRRDVFADLRFPVGKNYEDAFTTPEVLEHINLVACVEDVLYHYRLNPEGIMRGTASLKIMDEIDANYGLLQCALRHGKLDTAYLQYRFLKKRFRQNRKRLPPEDRNAQRVQQAMECVRRAGEKVKQCGADTLKNRLETELWFIYAPFYYKIKRWN